MNPSPHVPCHACMQRRYVYPKPVTMQIYSMGECGTTTIQKSGHIIERNIFNDIWLDGVKVN